MEEYLKIFPGLGVGGALAGFIFWQYVRFSKESAERQQQNLEESRVREDRALSVLERVATGLTDLAGAIHRMETDKRDEMLTIIREIRGQK